MLNSFNICCDVIDLQFYSMQLMSITGSTNSLCKLVHKGKFNK